MSESVGIKTGRTMLLTKLLQLQAKVRAEKGQRNNFGKYNYRTLSDIFEAIKQLMFDMGLVFVFSDTVELIGGEPYLKSIGTLYDADTGECLEVSAIAREPLNQSGMSAPQMTGSAVTYCHKYLLTSLLNLVDHEMDAMLDPDAQEPKKAEQKPWKTESDTVIVKGKEVPRRYYEACVFEVEGEKLLSIYSNDRERFNTLGQFGDATLQAYCAIIADYKLKEEKNK